MIVHLIMVIVFIYFIPYCNYCDRQIKMQALINMYSYYRIELTRLHFNI